MAAKGGAAAAAAVPDSEDDSVPCAAPTPQPRCLVPSGGPEVAALTPEREGGILRRHQQRRDKIQPRQVRTAGWVGVATPRLCNAAEHVQREPLGELVGRPRPVES